MCIFEIQYVGSMGIHTYIQYSMCIYTIQYRYLYVVIQYSMGMYTRIITYMCVYTVRIQCVMAAFKLSVY